MGFNRILQWLLPVSMSLFLVTGCGDLEPEMQDTRTVILKMDFDQRSSSRSSSRSPSELIQYNTHLILAVKSTEELRQYENGYSTSIYSNNYSMHAQGLVNTEDNTVSLKIPFDTTQMKIFAFLFRDTIGLEDFISGDKEVGNYGESQSFLIGDSGSISVDLKVPEDLTATGGASQVVLDWTAVSGATSYTVYWGSATGVSSSSTSITSVSTDSYTHTGLYDGTTYYYKVAAVDSAGTGMLSSEVNATTFTTGGSGDYGNTDTTAPVIETVTAVTTPTSDSTPDYNFSSTESGSITYGGLCATAGSATTNAIVGHNLIIFNTLSDGSYINCTITVTDPAGNESTTLQIPDFTVQTIPTLPAPYNLSASGANNTITLTWNSVSGASSYILYWDNVSGIDSSDNPINVFTNDNYTHSNMDNDSIYYYKVAAVNSSGTGTLSSVASALLSSYVKDSASLSGHTFAITSAAMNWNNAKVQATALGGYLTTVNSKAENDWLTTRFRIQHGAELWIGANDIATNNTWVWDNGTTSGDSGLTDNLSGNAKWADNITRKWVSGEPNHSGASCGQIWKTSGPNWDDTPCNNNKYAIIEFD